jgi:hypothetical protein
MIVFIHHHPGIPWHTPFARKLRTGLNALGIDWELVAATDRLSDDLAILLGTTCFREVEASGPYLLVDRCSFGDTDQYVSLVLNGHGRRGDHRVPVGYDDSRWKLHGVPLAPPVSRFKIGRRTILCGQWESYSPRYPNVADWYRERERDATHFRPHPATGDGPISGVSLPIQTDWRDAYKAITLNSSVAIQALIDGLQVVVDDEGGMAYNYSTRIDLLHWLAWTQWHHDEIEQGTPIGHLFE